MAASGKIGSDAEIVDDTGCDLAESIEAYDRLQEELSFLFGRETVVQASHIDIADLNLTKDMTDSISAGIRQLKKLRTDPDAQKDLVNGMEAGARIVLCMWIMEMDLLEKIQSRSYLTK